MNLKYKISKVVMVLSAVIGCLSALITIFGAPWFGLEFLKIGVVIELQCALVFYVSMHFYFKYK